MHAKESAASNFDLPQDVLEILPSDPFEQLDVARKITSIALSTRVSSLESEASFLRAKLTEKDDIIADLQSQIQSLGASHSETTDKLARADHEKESLLRDNALLTTSVKKLNRDVAKLEVFRKTLMQSLQEDEESSGVGKQIPKQSSLSSVSSLSGEDDATQPPSRSSSISTQLSGTEISSADNRLPSRSSSITTQFSETDISSADNRETDASKPGNGISSYGPLLVSQTSTPRLTPPGSPPSLSASVSPRRTSRPLSPRRHSVSFATTRGMYDDRSSLFSSHQSSISSSDSGAHTGRTRVDGKEFFRQVRSRLSYEQFGAFLANVKELNSHKQTREETLRKADEIFGPDNKDLFAIFEGLITRNVH